MPEQAWTTEVGEVGEGTINVRGYPLEEIIEELSFAEATFLTLRGELPTAEQARVMDAVLCSILEHGFYAPTTLAARMVTSASPESVIPGVAAGLLTIGSITVSPQHTAQVIARIRDEVKSGSTVEDAASQFVTELLHAKQRMPGLGHPLHPDGDPRAKALHAVAAANGCIGELTGFYMAVKDEYLRRTNRQLPVNIDGMLGCVLSELGFSAFAMPGVAAISFMPGIVAHCVEEVEAPPTLRVADGKYAGVPPRALHKNGKRN